MKTEILEQIGLSKNEIKIYFALLELDQSTVTPIVKKSGIPNSKIYPTLEKLIKKGLVSYVIKNNVKHFQASDPNHLIDFLNSKEKQIEAQKKEIERIIPEIEKRRSLGDDKQEATVYEGFKGVKIAINSILNIMKPGEEYFAFSLGDELGEKKLINFFREYHRKRKAKNIKARLLSNEKREKVIKKHYKYLKTVFRFTKSTFPTGIFIYGNNVMTIVWGDRPTAFVITSKRNADIYKEFFEEMWKKARK